MIFPDSPLIAFSSLQMALDQPAFPGKLILWSLLMLSLICWVMILSKAITLKKMKRADVLFTRRLRRSRTTLEVFEEGWNDENSLHHEIYLYGAKEAAFQLLGTREPNPTMHNRIKKAEKLNSRQIELLREAFVRGQEAASDRLLLTIPTLQAIAVSTPLLGAAGMMWMLMRGFAVAQDFTQIAPWVSGSFVFMVLALSVTLPAAVAKIIFQTSSRHRSRELNDFRVEVARLFERSFGNATHDSDRRPSPENQSQEPIDNEETDANPSDQSAGIENNLEYQYKPKPSSGGRREFRSLRRTERKVFNLAESIADDDDEEMNPIAKQAAGIRTAF